jgi:DNA topoisomerase-1
MKPDDLTEEDAIALLQFPREIGKNPLSGEVVSVIIGRYGPFVKCGEEIRNVSDWRTASNLDLTQALELLAAPKEIRGRGGFGRASTPAAAIQDFGKLEGAQGNVRVLSGRYGPYVTDGKTNATLPKTLSPESITSEEAMELLRAKAAAGPSKKKPFKRKRQTA